MTVFLIASAVYILAVLAVVWFMHAATKGRDQ